VLAWLARPDNVSWRLIFDNVDQDYHQDRGTGVYDVRGICLAITEAFAGSDVARLRTTAAKTPDGKHYIVNGTKKWITNGVFCDYFVTGVQTDKGLSVLLIERGEGVETKPIKTSYSPAAGTAFITFDNVKVPASNLLGKENKGIYVILSNFNHERWTMSCECFCICPLFYHG